MDKSFFKFRTNQNSAEAAAGVLAIAIGIILLVAAFGKFFYPLESLKVFDRWVSSLEILFVLIIVFFRKRGILWLIAAIVFAAWGGYAAFWFFLQLPCNCMGSMIEIPTTLSLLLDAFFCISSLSLGFLLGAEWKHLYLTVLVCFFLSLVGYAIADWVYRALVIAYF